ncbi:MAG: DNA (cytosine-5)-methyltransferase 1 [Parvicella sp.]|jgi:DNA (cytosine-5)-methyltransferase 1
MKILNLYGGLGGNRKLWDPIHKVTTIEIDPELARLYSLSFPEDEVIVTDAHYYLLNHFEEYDFIWSSTPCPSHSRMNTMMYGFKDSKRKQFEYPDMKLYQEIILLSSWFKGKYAIENVIPYYEPLIPAETVDRHLFWANFKIGQFKPTQTTIIKGSDPKELSEFYGFNISDYKGTQRKDRILRNCVHPETGNYILKRAENIINNKPTSQSSLF